MNCGQCNLRFNTTKRRPIISACGHSICEFCRSQPNINLCCRCNKTINKNQWIVNASIIQILESKTFEVDLLVRICFIGFIGVGKTSLILRLCKQSFHELIQSTIALDFKVIDTEVQGVNFRFQLWDTAGQERFEAIYTKTYRDADIVVIVFDAANIYKDLIDKYDKLVEDKCKENVKRLYVVNQIDKTPVEKKDDYHYTSCKTNEGVSQLWAQIISVALKIPPEFIKFNKSSNNRLPLQPPKPKGCSC